MPGQANGLSQAATMSTAAETVETLADLLTGADFNLDIPGECSLLRISNAHGALCELNITTAGEITWEYRSCAGRHADPVLLAGLVRDMLDPDGFSGELPIPRADGLTLKGLAGRALADHGLDVSFHVLDIDDYFFDICAEISVANPARPERGVASVSDDGAIWWRCRTNAAGLTLPEIAATITQALVRARHLPCRA